MGVVIVEGCVFFYCGFFFRMMILMVCELVMFLSGFVCRSRKFVCFFFDSLLSCLLFRYIVGSVVVVCRIFIGLMFVLVKCLSFLCRLWFGMIIVLLVLVFMIMCMFVWCVLFVSLMLRW